MSKPTIRIYLLNSYTAGFPIPGRLEKKLRKRVGKSTPESIKIKLIMRPLENEMLLGDLDMVLKGKSSGKIASYLRHKYADIKVDSGNSLVLEVIDRSYLVVYVSSSDGEKIELDRRLLRKGSVNGYDHLLQNRLFYFIDDTNRLQRIEVNSKRDETTALPDMPSTKYIVHSFKLIQGGPSSSQKILFHHDLIHLKYEDSRLQLFSKLSKIIKTVLFSRIIKLSRDRILLLVTFGGRNSTTGSCASLVELQGFKLVRRKNYWIRGRIWGGEKGARGEVWVWGNKGLMVLQSDIENFALYAPRYIDLISPMGRVGGIEGLETDPSTGMVYIYARKRIVEEFRQEEINEENSSEDEEIGKHFNDGIDELGFGYDEDGFGHNVWDGDFGEKAGAEIEGNLFGDIEDDFTNIKSLNQVKKKPVQSKQYEEPAFLMITLEVKAPIILT